MAENAGDTVAPIPLFRPDLGESPPADAVDLYLDAPASVSKLWWRAGEDLDQAGAARLRGYLDQWRALATTEALKVLQKRGGYVKAGEHTVTATKRGAGARHPNEWQWVRTIGHHVPGQLEASPVSHLEVSGADSPASRWLHEHIYIGRQADSFDDPARRWVSGRWPVDLGTLRHAAIDAQIMYVRAMEHYTLGLRWTHHERTDRLEIDYPDVDDDLMDLRGADAMCPGAGVQATIRPSHPDGGGDPSRRGW